MIVLILYIIICWLFGAGVSNVFYEEDKAMTKEKPSLAPAIGLTVAMPIFLPIFLGQAAGKYLHGKK